MNTQTIIRPLIIEGYEEVLEVVNASIDLHAIIAIHSSSLGPACGGIRAYTYSSFEEALADVLKLSKAMTYKSAVAQTGTGGAKTVILLQKNQKKTKEMLLAIAEVIHSLEGRYYAGEDMGITLEDLAIMRTVTPYVVGVSAAASSGDLSKFTARGVFRGIEAVCRTLWGSGLVRGKRIAVQGLGAVGMKLVEHLFWEGAELMVADINPLLVEEAVVHFGARAVDPAQMDEIECEIFSPCAMGGILSKTTIPRLKCQAIAGAANNQLLEEEAGALLFDRGILYAPDFVINAGGLLNVSSEVKKRHYRAEWTRDRVDQLYELLIAVFEQSKMTKTPTHLVAIQMADYFLHEQLRKAI